MARKRTFDELLRDELWRELCEGEHIAEAYINGDRAKERVYGISEGKKVVVNPVHSVLDTLVHELTHRVRKKWGERRVIKETARIIAAMDDRTIRKWHRQYERVKVARKRPVECEDE